MSKLAEESRELLIPRAAPGWMIGLRPYGDARRPLRNVDIDRYKISWLWGLMTATAETG